MESIIETMLERNVTVYTEDPHTMVFDLIDKLKSLGEYDEKKNVYETDGPTKRIHLIFSIIEKMDSKSKIEIAFDLEGKMSKSSYLEIHVEGSLITTFQEPKTPIQETFLTYYLRNISQEYKKMAKDKMKEMDVILADLVKEYKHVYIQ